MNPDTEQPTTVQTGPTINNLRTEAMFRSKNITQYTEIVYWMLRTLADQGTITPQTLSAINLQLHAIKSNISELESGIYDFINHQREKQKGKNNG